VYFERGHVKSIAAELVQELLADLNATSPEEVACAEQFAKAEVGTAYGKWLKVKRP